MFPVVLGLMIGFAVSAVFAAFTGDPRVSLVWAVLSVAFAIIAVGFW